MKQLLFVTLFLASCSSGSSYVGQWKGYDKSITITEAKAGYILSDKWGSYPADLEGGKLVVKFAGKEAQAVLSEDEKQLFYLGNTYTK